MKFLYWKLDMFFLSECTYGRYGHNCLGSCRPSCKVPERCDKTTGHCTGGCQAAWSGLWCEGKHYINTSMSMINNI